MAKSLRSKPKLRAKSIKRRGEFAAIVNRRDARLAEKDKRNLASKKTTEETSMAMDIEPTAQSDAKVSTSGWRDSRSQIYKQKKLKKVNKQKTMKF